MEKEKRICTKCGKEKDTEDFAFRNKEKNIRKHRCRTCTSEYGINHYNENKKEYVARVAKNNKRYKREAKEYVLKYLQENPCIDCGEDDPIVLDFDHRGDKIKNIPRMLQNGTSLSTIKKEIAKCDVRCANCHRRKTAGERSIYKTLIMEELCQ